MKTFVVEGSNWRKEIQINEELFEKEADMGFEAMTQALECYIKGGDIEPNDPNKKVGLSFFMSAYDKETEKIADFDENNKVMCLLEPILINAGYHQMAEHFRNST